MRRTVDHRSIYIAKKKQERKQTCSTVIGARGSLSRDDDVNEGPGTSPPPPPPIPTPPLLLED